MKKKLKDFIGDISSDGEKISFKQFIEELSGNHEIYKGDYSFILDMAPNAEWDEVDDYISPFIKQIISDAVEIDREIYLEIINATKKAYNKIQEKLKSEEVHVIDLNADHDKLKQSVGNLWNLIYGDYRITEIWSDDDGLIHYQVKYQRALNT